MLDHPKSFNEVQHIYNETISKSWTTTGYGKLWKDQQSNKFFRSLEIPQVQNWIKNLRRIPPFGIQDPLNVFLDKWLPKPVYTPITAKYFFIERDPFCCSRFVRYPWLFASVSSISASTILLSRSLKSSEQIKECYQSLSQRQIPSQAYHFLKRFKMFSLECKDNISYLHPKTVSLSSTVSTFGLCQQKQN